MKPDEEADEGVVEEVINEYDAEVEEGDDEDGTEAIKAEKENSKMIRYLEELRQKIIGQEKTIREFKREL